MHRVRHHINRYGNIFFDRTRAYWQGFRGADPMLQVFSAIALVILIVVVMPYIVPTSLLEPDCSDLAGPSITGNNRSIQAMQTDPSALRLAIAPSSITIMQGQPLTINVEFINGSMAPLTLYLIQDNALLRYTQETGLQFEVQDMPNLARTFGLPASTQPGWGAPQQYTSDQIHVLEPRQQCMEHIQFTPDQLAVAGIVAGKYKITAGYFNQTKGQLPPVVAPTPTMMYTDQGVWTSPIGIQSNSISITIGTPHP